MTARFIQSGTCDAGAQHLDPLDGPLDDLLGDDFPADDRVDEDGNPVHRNEANLTQHHFYMRPRVRIRARSSKWLPMEDVAAGSRLVTMVRRGRSYVDEVHEAETPLVRLEMESKTSFVTVVLSAFQMVRYLMPNDRARGVRSALLSDLMQAGDPIYLPAKKGLYGGYGVKASKRSKATKRMFVKIDRIVPAGDGIWRWPVINKRSDWACQIVIEPGLSLPASGLHLPE
jgi:hypothetical protein